MRAGHGMAAAFTRHGAEVSRFARSIAQKPVHHPAIRNRFMSSRIKYSSELVTRTAWPICITDDDLNGPVLQIKTIGGCLLVWVN